VVDFGSKVTWHGARAIGIKIRDVASTAGLRGRQHGAKEHGAKDHGAKILFKRPAPLPPKASSFSFSSLSGFFCLTTSLYLTNRHFRLWKLGFDP
jgi:hypothetical protein